MTVCVNVWMIVVIVNVPSAKYALLTSTNSAQCGLQSRPLSLPTCVTPLRTFGAAAVRTLSLACPSVYLCLKSSIRRLFVYSTVCLHVCPSACPSASGWLVKSIMRHMWHPACRMQQVASGK